MTAPFRRPRAARRWAGAALAVLGALFAAAPLAAQAELEGRVVRGDAASAGVPGVPVELHRVGRDSSGQVAATVSGEGGRFRFSLPPVPEGGFTVFFATATVDGVRYFGPALHPDAEEGPYQVQVYDTTSAPEAVAAVRVARRDVILVPGMRGGWEVAEVVRVENPTGRTVVGPGGQPVFGIGVPENAAGFQTEEPMLQGVPGAEAPQDLVLMGDRVLAAVPLTPGGRDFFFRYRLPARTGALALPVGAAVDTLTVYVREPVPGVRVEGLGRGEPFEAEGDRFVRFTGTALAAEDRVTVRWSGPGGSPVDPRLAAGVLAALVLAGGALYAGLRRRAAA